MKNGEDVFFPISKEMGVRVQSAPNAAPVARFVRTSPTGDGKPLTEGMEIVSIKPREQGDGYDVTTLYRHGPARVSSRAYDEGWDRIFGKKEVN